MKKSIKNFASTVLILLVASGTLLFSSCKKNDDSITSATVTADDAEDAIASASMSSSNGMAEELTMASTYAASQGVYSSTSNFPCGAQHDTTFTRAATGANGSYSYLINWSYLLSCTSTGLPSSLAFTHKMDGTYDLPRMSSNDSATGSLTITGLAVSSANVTLNGTYIRNGSQTSKVRNLCSFTSQIVFTLNNVTVNKATQHINGGNATVVIMGAGSKGGSYSYNGSITFTNTGTCTLVLNGVSYTITLY